MTNKKKSAFKLLLIGALFLSLVTAKVLADDKKFSVGAELGYFAASDNDLKDLYGPGNYVYGLSTGFMVAEKWEVFASVNFYSDEGTTTITKEKIELKITHLIFGGYYHFNPTGISPLVGVGADVCFVNEKNPIQDFDDTSLGWFAAIGIEVPIFGDIKSSLNLRYTNATSEGDLSEVSLGGFHILLSVKWAIF